MYPLPMDSSVQSPDVTVTQSNKSNAEHGISHINSSFFIRSSLFVLHRNTKSNDRLYQFYESQAMPPPLVVTERR